MYYLNILLALALLTLGALPVCASAAELSFESEPAQPAVGTPFVVRVMLTTGAEVFNTVEGTIKVPSDLTVERVSTGGSAMTLWPISPRFVPSAGQIEFTGGVPENVGPNAKVELFTIHAFARAPGGYVLSSRNSRGYLADGNGTERMLPTATVRVTVSGTGGKAYTPARDRRSPTFVVAELGQDEALFNGQYFVTFSATDDQSGVTSYQVKEGRFGSYVPVERYYVLRDQSLDTPVWVRATDASGNHVTTRVVGKSASTLIVLGGILVLIAVFYLWRRYRVQR
ncbi:MAG: hypothetical protein KBD50_00925 [Candidatus Pacebacteria bacterium]|nr:hypothetical protein [Candidatus Paceibacterota bacterium]